MNIIKSDYAEIFFNARRRVYEEFGIYFDENLANAEGWIAADIAARYLTPGIFCEGWVLDLVKVRYRGFGIRPVDEHLAVQAALAEIFIKRLICGINPADFVRTFRECYREAGMVDEKRIEADALVANSMVGYFTGNV